MAKMINVDELIEFCNTERAMLHAHGNSVACAALRRVIEFAKEYAVEAEPVKHGKWIEKKVCRMKWIPYADDDVNPDDVDIECMTEQKCSYCKRWTIKFTYHIELDYCPLCGARMDGDGDA